MEIQFVEGSLFSKKLLQVATDEEFQVLQRELRADPEKGDVIKGAGGARKVRMALGGRGKSGGARVIYYVRVSRDRIYLLDIYRKGDKSDLSPQERKALAELVLMLKGNDNEKERRKT
jgi:mRNA-degrading endonuclease RelE of RelBE toxin-antitoxin system